MGSDGFKAIRGGLHGGHEERAGVASGHCGAGTGCELRFDHHGAPERKLPDAADLGRHRRRAAGAQHRGAPAEVREYRAGPQSDLTIRNERDPYHYAEVRGRVVEVVGGQRARDHIDELSQKYHGEDYDPDSIKSERVMMWIVPERQTITNQSEGV